MVVQNIRDSQGLHVPNPKFTSLCKVCIIGNTASALTAQKTFLNNFENVVNHRVDICKDIKRYQDTLSYASRKVAYSMGEGVLPRDMNLNISLETAGYNYEILVSDSL